MRCLGRNKTSFYYALYTGKGEATDSNGNYTGERVPTYGTPTAFSANISPARGSTNVEPFGIDIPYTKTIVTEDINCPISENSVLWIGVSPTYNNTSVPYNYVVTAVARSINSVTYAIKEVDSR